MVRISPQFVLVVKLVALLALALLGYEGIDGFIWDESV